jgi:hypothetical protein
MTGVAFETILGNGVIGSSIADSFRKRNFQGTEGPSINGNGSTDKEADGEQDMGYVAQVQTPRSIA